MTDAHDTHTVADSRGGATTAMSVPDASDLAGRVVENIETVIVDNRDAVEHVLTAVLGGGHVLLEDVPGVGKTMLARSVARSFDGDFRRVQFTPDLLPTDVTGVNVFNEKTREFEFQPGPVFANVLLADEINRAPPKTQSSLLEAMEEAQVTADGETRALPDPFVVVATQNAVERDRAYELPVAELDRFMKKLRLGYPDREGEIDVLDRAVGGHPIDDIEAVASVEDLRRARAATAGVEVARPVKEYVTELARYTRDHAALGVSPRGSISLLRASQGRAVLDGRDYVVPDDVQAEAEPVLAHRIRAEAGGTLGGEPARTLVQRALQRVDVE
ncbi:MoxR family ATPase [Halobacterium sp. CBA1132]|uniref:AAA family ATPase n=1 Tax=Halobacterium TaxID=2239 RepID=UPI00073F32C1